MRIRTHCLRCPPHHLRDRLSRSRLPRVRIDRDAEAIVGRLAAVSRATEIKMIAYGALAALNEERVFGVVLIQTARWILTGSSCLKPNSHDLRIDA